MKKVGVQCRNIRLSYGRTEVLRDVSLDVEPGEFFALLGPSGSGKSTLLRLIAGFAPHQAGELLVDGVDITGRPPWQRNIGMVFQSYALWPHMTVWDNVAFGLVERRVDRATLKTRVGAALELVGLSAYGARRPGQLSGGQQQRVALARTIVIEPQVLLLDEPLSNLDKTLRVQMRQELLALQRRLGITTIFVTHDQEEAMTTADRMAVLDHGVVQQVGTPTSLYDEPANVFVAGFVGTANLLPAGRLGGAGGSPQIEIEGVGPVDWPASAPMPQGETLALSFRPHALRLETEAGGPPHLADEIALRGRIEMSEFVGEFTRYRVRIGPHSVVVDQPHRSGRAPISSGTDVTLWLQRSAVRVFER